MAQLNSLKLSLMLERNHSEILSIIEKELGLSLPEGSRYQRLTVGQTLQVLDAISDGAAYQLSFMLRKIQESKFNKERKENNGRAERED